MIGTTLKTWLAAGAGTAVAMVVAGLLGAFAALPTPPVPDLPNDQPVDAGQWRLLPIRAYFSADDPYGARLKPDQQALVFEVDMTNRTAVSTKDYFDVFTPGGGVTKAGEQPFVMLTRDSTLSPDLHPAMPERMAYVWALPRDAPAPKTISLSVYAKIFKPRDNLYGTPGWFNPYVVGTFTLAIADRQAAEAVAP
jgi:hypothetical protein